MDSNIGNHIADGHHGVINVAGICSCWILAITWGTDSIEGRGMASLNITQRDARKLITVKELKVCSLFNDMS
jgi:hypothetical protein